MNLADLAPHLAAAGHLTPRGYWHPGAVDNCAPCSPPAGEWRCPDNQGHHELTPSGFGWFWCATCGAGPSYPERWRRIDPALMLGIYVPAPASGVGCIVEPGSAIVGDLMPQPNGRFRIYYEGWAHGAPTADAKHDARGRWEAGVEHAASRMVTAYPTIARSDVERDDIELIGHYHVAAQTIDVFEPGTLNEWTTPPTARDGS